MLVAQFPIVLHALRDNPLQVGRFLHRQPHCRHRTDSGGHFIQHQAKRPDIGTLVNRFAASLLGSHIGRGSENRAGIGCRDGLGGCMRLRNFHLGQAEVQELGLAPYRDEDIGRFDVAVHNACTMGGVQRIGDLDAQVHQRLQVQPADGVALLQGGAFQVFHGDEGSGRPARQYRRSCRYSDDSRQRRSVLRDETGSASHYRARTPPAET